MSVSTASATYRVRIADQAATVVSGNVAATLTQAADFEQIPVVSGPSVDLKSMTTTSHPFRLRCISDTPLFTSSGRMVALGRLVEVQRDVGAGYVTIATGRLSHISETERGLVDVEVSDEHWVERRQQIFETTDTMQLHPPGLTAAWKDQPAAGTNTYTVSAVSGDAFQITTVPNEGAEGSVSDYQSRIPLGLMEALASDIVRAPSASAANSAGNFTSTRFEYDGGDRVVISFSHTISARLLDLGPGGILGPLSPYGGDGILRYAWIYRSGHGLSATDTITGRFYWPSGIPISEKVPLHIGGTTGIHPGELLEDILDGDYGGQAELYNATAMTTLQALSMRPVWARITKSANRGQWLAKNLYKPYLVAPLVGTDLELRPTCLRLPIDTDPDTLEVIDASEAQVPTWEHPSRDLITKLVWKSTVISNALEVAPTDGDGPADGVVTRLYEPTPGFGTHDTAATLGEIVHEVETELILKESFPYPDEQEQLAVELFNLFGDGPQRGTIDVADNLDVQVGDIVSLDHDTLQGFNANTGDRTGNRLVRLIEAIEVAPHYTRFAYLDLGPHSQPLDPPTVSIAEASDLDYVEVTISDLNAGETAIVEVEHGTSLPSTYSHVRANVGNETVSFRLAAAGGNAYCRARAVAPGRISSDWATDSVALTTRATIDAAKVSRTGTQAVVTWTVPAVTLGVRTDYDIHARFEAPTFGSNVTDYDADDGGFTITGPISTRDMVTVRLTPYPGWTGAAVSGSAGEVVEIEAVRIRTFPGAPDVPTIIKPSVLIGVDDAGEVLVAAVGDAQNTTAIYVTVGDGSSPSDPTSSDDVISGSSGVVATGVAVTPGNDIYVKAVSANSSGVLSEVVEVRQTYNDVFPGEQLTGSNPVFTGQVDVEGGEGATALRLFSSDGGHIGFFDTTGAQQAAMGYSEGPDDFFADIDTPMRLDVAGTLDVVATGAVDIEGTVIQLLAASGQKVSFVINSVERGSFGDPGASNNTSLVVYIDNGSVVLRRVRIGAADSGGSGFRLLRVDN